YREGNRGTYSSLVWLDRRGVGVGREVIRGHELFNEFFALSHDGRRLVYGLNAAGQGSTDLWVHDLRARCSGPSASVPAPASLTECCETLSAHRTNSPAELLALRCLQKSPSGCSSPS